MSKSLPSHRRTLGVLLVAAVVGCDGGTTGPTIGPPAKLAFTVQPTDATAGASIAPAAAVAIQDASGNVVTTGTNAVTIAIGTNPAGGTLSGTATVNAVSGVANFTDLTIELAVSGYTLIASATGLTSATSAEFSITPAAAAQLGFTVQPTATEGNQPIAPAIEVTIRDAFGNTVTTAMDAVTVAIGTNPGGGTLSGTKTVSAVGGIATFANLSIDLPGSGYTLEATSGTLTGATSSPFDIVLTFSAVSGGTLHTCGLTAGGDAYCWGFNDNGALGDGTTTQRLTPVLVSGGLSFASLSAGGGHTCGLTAGGDAYCWGFNDNGQLGDGTTTNRFTPVRVIGQP